MLIAFALALALQSPEGAKVYEDHCASCHNGSDPRTPVISVLRQKTAEEIVAALTSGKMREQGSSLSEAERRGVAAYLGVSGATAATEAGRCSSVLPFDASTGPRWTSWSPDLANTRFQPQPGLSADQVPKLTLKWAFGFPNATVATGLPTVAGGRVFVGSQNGTVYSLDAKSGCIVWTFKAKARVRAGIVIGPRAGAAGKYAAYVGDGRSNVYALDAATGEQLWMRSVDDHRSSNI